MNIHNVFISCHYDNDQGYKEALFGINSKGGSSFGSVGWYIELGWLAFRKRASVYR